MTTIKSYTDIEQSKKLAEILPIESADMWYQYTGISIKDGSQKPIYFPMVTRDCESDEDIPCWSLAALLDALKLFTIPTAFSVKVCVPLLTKTSNGYSLTYTGDYTLYNKNNLDIAAPIETIADNPIDACYEMILKLHELNLL